MRKIFMLSFANIRKSRGNAVSLLLMFIIASMLFNVGLLIFARFGNYFVNITKELKTSDVYYIIPDRLYNADVDNYITNNDNIIKLQKEKSLWTVANVPYNKTTREIIFLINDADEKRDISRWKFAGKHLAPDSMSVYLPYVMNVDAGYKLNDKISMKFKETTLTFTIKGFIEDSFFSSLDAGFIGAYLPHETFQSVYQQLGEKYGANLVFANLKNVNKDVESGIRERLHNDSLAIADITSSFFSLDINIMKMSRTLMAGIVSVMTMAFAIIISIVCLIVVRFRIGNSIEDDMTKIGSLKAIGYTSRQIISSVVVQFSMIALAGNIAGIALSYLTTPVLSEVFAHQSGLMWVQGFDAAISIITLSVVISVVVIVAFLAARRINKLHPIVALRGGLITHNFRKNHMPLHKSKGSLPLVLGIKSMLQNMKQSIMIAVIFTAVAFASSFAIVMFYNTSVDTKAFAETPGIEISNVIAVLPPDADNSDLVNSIGKMKDVRKIQFIDMTGLKIENNLTTAYVMEDFSKKETNTVYEGRYPSHSNEVAIAGYFSKLLGKNIGDSVSLQSGDKKADYTITGLTQGSNMGGMNISLRLDGIRKLNPDYKQQGLQIYLNKGIKADNFIDNVTKLYGNKIIRFEDMDKAMEQGMGVYVTIVSKVGMAILGVTVLVVLLVLYFVINSSVIRKKRELGIQKAFGYTTSQLMNQLSLSFLPPIIIGVVTGSIIGITQTNAIMSVAQRSMGIMKANFIITPSWIVLCGAGIVVISYLTSMFITYKIRKISAYTMVTE